MNMVTLSKSEEGSETDLDLNLHLSDTENDEILNKSVEVNEDLLSNDCNVNNEEDLVINISVNTDKEEVRSDMKETIKDNEEQETEGLEYMEENEHQEETEVSLESEKLLLEDVCTDDIEDFLDAEIIVKADFSKSSCQTTTSEESDKNLEDNNVKLDSSHDDEDNTEDEAQNGVQDEKEVIQNNSGQKPCELDESKGDGDLLLVIDEKEAELDAKEYEENKTKQDSSDQDSEELLKEDSCNESTKSSPRNSNNEDNEEKTDIPDDMMDIGDSVLDIGDIADTTIPSEDLEDIQIEEESQEKELIETKPTEDLEVEPNQDGSEQDQQLESGQDMDIGVATNQQGENHMEDDDMEIEEILNTTILSTGTPNENDIEIKDDSDLVIEKQNSETVDDTISVMDETTTEEKDMLLTTTNTPILEGDNKENIQDKSIPSKTGTKTITEKVKPSKEPVQYGVTTRSLRKRVSADGGDSEDRVKKFKATPQSMNSAKQIDSAQTIQIKEINETKDEDGGIHNESETKVEGSGTTNGCVVLKTLLDNPEDQSLNDCKPKLGEDCKEKFMKMMPDLPLKAMDREALEAFVVQKICESLVYKTEVVKLVKCLKDREATIDALQKEVHSMNKQSKDLYIVHEKILQDLQRFKKNSDKPLMIPKITRSVGLQAFTREVLPRKPAVATPIGKPPTAVATGPPAYQQLPKLAPRLSVGAVTSKPQPVKVMQTQQALPRPAPPVVPVKIAQKPVTRISPATQVAKTPPRIERKMAAVVSPAVASSPSAGPGPAQCQGAGVIDLTSDDEKKQPTSTPHKLPDGTKLLQPPEGHKYVIVNGQSVMVKMSQKQNNIVLNNNAVMKMITPVRAAAQASVLRSTNTVNSNTTPTNARTATPTSAPPVRNPPKIINRVVKHKHPAPFPIIPQKNIKSSKPIPPRPQLTLTRTDCGNGIILSWKISSNLELFSEIASYQIYAYQETKGEPKSDNWSKIGDVKALQLPMAVTLTQFVAHNRYFFAVRAVDVLTRVGPFSEHQTI